MEQPNTIFSLNIDPVTKSHLLETSKWARFLAIAGMVSLVFLVIIGLYMSTVMTTNMNEQFETSPNSSELAKGLQVGIAIVYIIIAIVWFFPLLFLLRFANHMRSAIAANHQENLNTAFQNLKICFRYLGIVTVIAMVIYAVSILVTIGTMSSM